MENSQKLQLAGLASVKYNIRAVCRNADGSIAWVDEKKNLIATVGRAVFAQRLAQDFTYTGAIKFGALGSSITSPANGDVKLGTETASTRKAPNTYSATSNKAFISFIWGASEAVGSHKEFGTFIDGSATIDSGILFSHLAVDWVKTNAQSLTVDCAYTIS
jgi:hypothetical protein